MKVHIPPPDNFIQITKETAQWCALRASVDDPEHALRSAELTMLTPVEYISERDVWSKQATAHQFKKFTQRLDGLVSTRRKLLVDQSMAADLRGRLLVCEPLDTDSSGGSWATSRRYFDPDDCPPWDTWICALHVEEKHPIHPGVLVDYYYLLSWVPEELYSIVIEGIRASVTQCIYWLDAPLDFQSHPILSSLNEKWQNASTNL